VGLSGSTLGPGWARAQEHAGAGRRGGLVVRRARGRPGRARRAPARL